MATEPDAPTPQSAWRGARIYSRPLLSFYDLVVLGVVTPKVWGVPIRRILDLYDRNVGARHLELGPGTGYLLRRGKPGSAQTQLTLVDLNQNVLTHAARRLAAWRPQTYRRDILRPFRLGTARFDSIALNFVLHCLPGSMADKAVVFDHAAAVAAPGARIFGTTILGDGAAHTFAGRRMLAAFNRTGMFHNTADTLQELDRQLASRFTSYNLDTYGTIAFFEVRCDESDPHPGGLLR
ncbi:class I SAM-dependent methyltransferase [Nocardia sp. SC052]|uniref:class I SAM-dependent methyltransferase n=1 Tax=Nocardia sichangensis TaxID=3385975 RepID=UPI0039A0490D